MHIRSSCWKFEKEQDKDMVTKHLTTNNLLITRQEMATLQWRNLADVFSIWVQPEKPN